MLLVEDWAYIDFEITRNYATDYMWWNALFHTAFLIPTGRVIFSKGGTTEIKMDSSASETRGGD